MIAHHVFCDYCRRHAKLVSGAVIYPHRPDLSHRMFWYCEPCGAYVGTHAGSPHHAPLGRLANAELRVLKQLVHARFDPLWKTGRMTRLRAYGWLAKRLGIPSAECHVGMFDPDRCRAALAVLRDGPPG